MATKTISLLKMLSIVTLLVMAGCSDDDEPKTTNTITMDGASFKIQNVSLIGVSIDNEGHAGISFTGSDGSVTKVLTIDIEYSPLTTLDGTYASPQFSTHRYMDDFLTNYSEFNGTTEISSTNLDFGSIIVQQNSESNFTFTIDVTMLDGTKFQGVYQGKVDTLFNNG
jgi:hypothetical protein